MFGAGGCLSRRVRTRRDMTQWLPRSLQAFSQAALNALQDSSSSVTSVNTLSLSLALQRRLHWPAGPLLASGLQAPRWPRSSFCPKSTINARLRGAVHIPKRSGAESQGASPPRVSPPAKGGALSGSLQSHLHHVAVLEAVVGAREVLPEERVPDADDDVLRPRVDELLELLDAIQLVRLGFELGAALLEDVVALHVAVPPHLRQFLHPGGQLGILVLQEARGQPDISGGLQELRHLVAHDTLAAARHLAHVIGAGVDERVDGAAEGRHHPQGRLQPPDAPQLLPQR
mmetsp:Transcript_10931/g.22773  ORF Transcript_10931/g.22773 Transcript_10931/m.22773 type:complete len:287 (-) Transcript_10931:342-1202(-)